MFMVYWSEIQDDASIAHSMSFDSNDMRSALQLMEELRTRQRTGEPIGFVTMSSENPHSVGHPGVADPSPDYKWKKRRR